MCGLAGLVDASGDTLAQDRINATLASLAHRGPDARGIWQEGPCTFLHSRLRVLDTSERADQPMCRGAGRRVVMVYNGEIYNHRLLRQELEREGDQFTTNSDAEVFLAGFSRWGQRVFRKVRGMWAVAFWEPADQRLTMSRDPLGKKPLVYMSSHNRIAFGSSVTAILSVVGDVPEIDLSALDCYLGSLVVPHEHSIFQGMRKVPPGCVVTWSPRGRSEVTRYWALPEPEERHGSSSEIANEVERLLRLAVRRRLESDVPLGLFLSAGYDSGIIAALAAQESGRSLVAVTAGTRGSRHDERSLAAIVAQRYGLSHRPVEVPALTASSLPLLMAELGEPFGDSSIVPSYDVARAARGEMTVALTGDGGDEAFFGYSTFRGVHLAARYRQCVPSILRDALWRATRQTTTQDWRRGLAAVCEYGRESLAQSFRNRMAFMPEERARLLRLASNGEHCAEHVYADRLRTWSTVPDADALRRTWYETYLPNDYLTKVDTATMAASLEARSPFLDVDLVEFLLRLPQPLTFPGGRLKALLRPLATRLLPPTILARPKTGFSVPVDEWLRGALRPALEEFVLRQGMRMADLVEGEEVRRLLVAHERGADHGTRLWALLALGVWMAVVVEGRWLATDPLPVSGPGAP
jgi:asparagine synthase (glutamine-hydrolysing)